MISKDMYLANKIKLQQKNIDSLNKMNKSIAATIGKEVQKYRRPKIPNTNKLSDEI